MNILVIQSTDSGVYYHRQLTPHITWTESGDEFSDDFVVIVPTKNRDQIERLINNYHFDIIQFSLDFAGVSHIKDFIPYMKRRGSKIVLDVDDRYLFKVRKDILKAINAADAITTVSDNLAKHFSNYGAKRYPYIIENGVDSQDMQFRINPVNNSDIVFGYLGSTNHEADLLKMGYNFDSRKLFVVCEEYSKILNVDYYSKLRNWREYAWEYDAIDVALAPLEDNPFNAGKSFLKVIEAGFKKKAIICSDVEPYNRSIHSEFKSVVDYIPLGKSWRDRIESYTLEEAHQRGEELYKLVQPFEIRNLNKKRREIYLKILNR